MRGVVATTSPSMDIQISSNFERCLFEACGRDAALVRAQMASLAQSGRFELGAALPAVREAFSAAAASEAQVAAAIRAHAIRKAATSPIPTPPAALSPPPARCRRNTAPQVILSTAHPAKFPDAIAAITGHTPPLPPRLSRLMTDRERFARLPNDLKASRRLRRHEGARPRRRRCMTTNVTRLCQRLDGRQPPHAASGDDVARSLGRLRRTSRERRRARHLPLHRAHGLQGHRDAQRPRHRRGDRAGRRRAQRRHQPGEHGVFRACPERRRARRPRPAVRHSPELASSTPTSWSASAR